jgi:hypothetical protein
MNDATNPVTGELLPEAGSDHGARVKHFRQILLWPVYLIPPQHEPDLTDYAQRLLELCPSDLWREVSDEFTTDPAEFQERHYNEFVAFLPAVQRFLYGHGHSSITEGICGATPIRVLRRCDIARARVELRRGDAPVLFEVAHADLYFFFDIDVAVLALEIHADDLPLALVQDVMFQFGRAYPSYWEESGQAGHCPARVEWLDASGAVLAVSDYEDRRKFLNFTARHRAVCVASHWEYLLQPLALADSGREGPFAYRQLEYHRMPLMAYLSLDNPQQLGAADISRLAMASGGPEHDRYNDAARYPHFDTPHDTARFHELRDARNSGTRYLSSARALVIVGDSRNELFTHIGHGALSRFRHQDFLLYLIVHFHRAALLMFSDRLAEAVGRLDMHDVAAVQIFRRVTREALEAFLRFTHRYWFSQVSDQAETADLFDMCRQRLGLDRLYGDIRQEVQDMSQYLENEAMRRQNETIVRLTVVTIFGLIGTVATGFLGMNLFAYSDETPLTKLWLFAVVTVPTVVIMFLMIRKSRQLSEFLDAVSAEEWNLFSKLKGLGRGKKRA